MFLKKLLSISLLLTVTSFSQVVYANSKIKIATFLSPIASLISQVGQEKVEIEILSNTNACVHHHHLKPNQLKSLLDSDLVVLVSKDFDGKIIERIETNHNKILYLTSSQLDNFHIWLNIDSAIQVLKEIYERLIEISPNNKEYFTRNFETSKQNLANLKNQLSKWTFNPKEYLLLSKNLYHFLQNYPSQPQAYFISQQNLRLSDITNLYNMVREKNYKYIIIDEEQSLDRLKSLFKDDTQIIQLNSEHWDIIKGSKLDNIYKYYTLENAKKLGFCE